jgi:hypothetical protein
MVPTPESHQYITFSTPWGLFEYRTGMFGLSCMPPEFQRRMEEIFRIPVEQGWLIINIDDGLITSDAWQEHIWPIFMALCILQLKKNRIAFEKSFFGYPELQYPGYKLNSIGVDKGRVQAIVNWDTPKNRADIQSYLDSLAITAYSYLTTHR